MKLMFVGDTHGNTKRWFRLFEKAEEEGADTIIQVGDFGYWEHTRYGKKYLDDLNEATPVPLVFIDGNHDNHPLLWNTYRNIGGKANVRENITYQHRGSADTYDNKVILFVGGAFSIDLKWRKTQNLKGSQHECWWETETITDANVAEAIQSASWFSEVDILVAHDAPEGAPISMLSNVRLSPQLEDLSRKNRYKLKEIVDTVKPKSIIHGHYHTPLNYRVDSIPCVSLACDTDVIEYQYFVMDTEE